MTTTEMQSTITDLTIVEPIHGALSTQLQAIARRYIDARQRHGQALLDAATALSEAREAAGHGDWYTFLEATHTSAKVAERLLAIHAKAQSDPAFADAVKRDWLSFSVAALLSQQSTSDDVVAQALAAPQPPTARAIQQTINAKSDNVVGFETPRTLQQIRDQHDDLVFRLSAHGWDSIGKPRQKGMTTFISFRHGGTGEENEMAEGELPYWLAQLDESKALREAQRKPLKTPAQEAVAPVPVVEVVALDPTIRPALESRGWRFIGSGLQGNEIIYHIEQAGRRLTKTAAGLVAMLAMVVEPKPVPVEPPAPPAELLAAIEPRTTQDLYTAFDAIIDEWQRTRSAAAGLVWLCCLSSEQQQRNDRLSAVMYGWTNDTDRERIAAVLAEAQTQIALPPLTKVDRQAFEAEVRDLIDTQALEAYPLVGGLLRAVSRYAAIKEVV